MSGPDPAERIWLRMILTRRRGRTIEHVSDQEFAWTAGADLRETVRLVPGYTALPVPTGALAVVIDVADAVKLTLMGEAWDEGIPVAPAVGALGIPIVIPLGALTKFGIHNGDRSAQEITIAWL